MVRHGPGCVQPRWDVVPRPDVSTAVAQLEAGTPAMQPRQRLRPVGRGREPQVRLVMVRSVSALSALSGLRRNLSGIFAAILKVETCPFPQGNSLLALVVSHCHWLYLNAFCIKYL